MKTKNCNVADLIIRRMCGRVSVLAILTLAVSCKKFVTVDAPTTSLAGSTVYSSNATAAAAVTYVYENMMTGASLSNGNTGISMLAGLSSDELVEYIQANATMMQFYTNALNSSNTYFWNEPYQYIYVANSTIAGLENSPGVTTAMRQQLTGEAEFIRAFMYFYLVNLYGNVPLATTPDYLTNNTLTRAPTAQVYQQIVNDLTAAQGLLPQGYVNASGSNSLDRVRPNQGAATALLARVYLFTGDWKNAEAQATAVINNTAQYSLCTNLSKVFLANSTETIWQLEPLATGYDTYDAYFFILKSGPNGTTSVSLSPFMLNKFEAGDARYTNWVGVDSSTGVKYYYPYKYKVGYGQPITEYLMMLRLAEQYLIRAEARMHQGNIVGPSGALADLNTIRSRAGLGPYAGATDSASVLTAIMHERAVELFTEWGHRWLDLKRTGEVNEVMDTVTPAKGGGSWNANWALYPLPRTELLNNPHLTQNPGYN